jgi:hypothetical protein
MRSLRLKTQSDFGHKNLQIVRFTYSPSYPCFYGEFIMQMTTFCKVSYYAFIIVNLNSKLFWDYQVIFTDFISTDDYSILSFNSISNEKWLDIWYELMIILLCQIHSIKLNFNGIVRQPMLSKPSQVSSNGWNGGAFLKRVEQKIICVRPFVFWRAEK